MTIRKRHCEALTATPTAQIGSLGLGVPFGKLLGIRARLWASAAKTSAGADPAVRLKVTDGNSKVIYLDAADRDYATAEVDLNISQDDTATGLGITPVDATGALATAGAGAPVWGQGPFVVSVVNAGTATDFMAVDLIVEV